MLNSYIKNTKDSQPPPSRKPTHGHWLFQICVCNAPQRTAGIEIKSGYLIHASWRAKHGEWLHMKVIGSPTLIAGLQKAIRYPTPNPSRDPRCLGRG